MERTEVLEKLKEEYRKYQTNSLRKGSQLLKMNKDGMMIYIKTTIL
jgi:hypothetical protein